MFSRESTSYYEALSEVSLSVEEGEIVGVIGHNGAGKSTLLRTLAGVYPLSSGEVVSVGSVSSLFELGGMGGTFITGKQFIERWMRINNVPRKDWKVIIEDIRDFSELGERIEDRIYTYSSGMAARLYFSTATSFSHKIYLIDEILAVGDEHFQSKCWLRLRKRLAGGVSGVLVTHDWAAILNLCEYACEIKQGSLVNHGISERVICDYLKVNNQLRSKSVAKFSTELLTEFHGVSNEDWNVIISVSSIGYEPVYFNYSIEKLIPGKDWQILFLDEECEVSREPGEYEVEITIPELPLPSGDYRLCLFLNGEKPLNGGTKPAFDIRSWTSGNSLKLTVEGVSQRALISLPVQQEPNVET
jgi:lipopolysaccharide transport system ATP-binding protein